jgi:hypothetical protein
MSSVLTKMLTNKSAREEKEVKNLSLNAGEFLPWWS